MSQYSSYNYLTEQSAGDIIKNAFTIYIDYFSTFFAAYFLPVFSSVLFFFVLLILLLVMGNTTFIPMLFLPWMVISMFMGIVAVVSITVIVSDICIGNTPTGVKQSYRMITPALLGKLFLSYLLYFVLLTGLYIGVISLGSLLTSLPVWGALAGGILLAALFVLIGIVLPMFFPSVIVLEGKWGFNAFKRSFLLGRGFYLRNLGILVIFFICFFMAYLLIGLVLAILPPPLRILIGLVVSMVIYLTLICFPIICVVLMYYDIRVRKEGYDAAALAEDLKL
jgi:hypothetical protein